MASSSKKLEFVNSELNRIASELSKAYLELKDGKKVNVSALLNSLLRILFYGASFEKLHESYKLNIFWILRHVLNFSDTWSLQNGIKFKDKLTIALSLRIMCFDADTELISTSDVNEKQKYSFICNALQRHLGFQAESLKNIVYQGISNCDIKSGVPKRTILYLPSTLLTYQQDKWKAEHAGEISRIISQWFLLHCNQISATSGGRKSLLQSKKLQGIPSTTEIDGTSARGIFTVFNNMARYSGDWLMSIYCFAILKQWVQFLQGSNLMSDCLTNTFSSFSQLKEFHGRSPLRGDTKFYDGNSSGSDSADNRSITSSMSSTSDFFFSCDLYDHLETSQSRPATPFGDDTAPHLTRYKSAKSLDTVSITSDVFSSSNLKHVAIKYCLRMMTQSERVARRDSDRIIVTAGIVECLQILDILCNDDVSVVQKAFVEVKRFYARIENKPLITRRVYVALIQFFLHHYEAMIFQMDDILESYFREIPSNLYDDQIAAFEVLNLCLNNKTFFSSKTKVLSTYFPNVLKLIAWWPCTFLEEACDILEVFCKPENILELLHTILDLPSLSALLYLKHYHILEDNDKLEEFLRLPIKHYFKHMFSFFLREKSGGGETIDKLSELHTALEVLAVHPRVKYVSDIVPPLLISFFNIVTQSNEVVHVKNIFPLLLERCFQLFPRNDNLDEILDIFAGQLEKIARMAPDVISHHCTEILTFFSQLHSVNHRISGMVSSVVWCVGECAPSGCCCRQDVLVFYETLETMLFEGCSEKDVATNILAKPEIITSIVSAISKLAAYSQELIPRAIVGLNKICTMRHCRMQDLPHNDILPVITFAEEMIHVLRKPKVAPAILCQKDRTRAWHLDADSSLTMKIHLLSAHADNNNR